jgi:Membrane-associated phospholipid phosphatase
MLRSPSASPSVTLLLAGLCLLSVVVLAVLIEAGATRPLDVAIIDAVRNPTLVAPFSPLAAVTNLGSTVWITGVSLAVLAVQIVARRPWLGVAAAATIGLASLGNGLVKELVHRVRPDLLPPIEIEPGYSFPSGHAALSMAAYGIIAVLILRSRLPTVARWLAVTILALVVGLVGISRVYLGVHYPSDVLGGWLAGGMVVLLFVSATRARSAGQFSREASKSRAGGAAAADRAAPRSDRPAPD